MAYDWFDKQYNGGSGGTSPTPTVRRTQPTRTPTTNYGTAKTYEAPKVNVQNKANTPVHGKFWSGGFVSKAMDILRLPEYALGSFGTASYAKSKEQAQQAKARGNYDDWSWKIPAVGRSFKAGAMNVVPGIMNRRQISANQGDYNFAEAVGVDGSKSQAALNFGMSLGVPAPPLAKPFTSGAKVLSKLPAVSKLVKGGNKLVNIARKDEELAKNIERIPGLDYFRNPAAGKVISKGRDTAERRISGLYHNIHEVAKGLTIPERIEVGRIIEGGKAGDPRLMLRARYINQISDDIARELIESGLMTEKSFAKFKGKYMAHIADTVRTEERARGKSGVLRYTSDSLKQRKDKLGKEGMPDYIKEFQFPTFKALGQEISNIESVKVLSKLASDFGTKINTKAIKKLPKNIDGTPRVTADGKVLLRDVLPQQMARRKEFRDVVVPREIAEYITKQNKAVERGIINKTADMGLNLWKLGKTVYSGPAYHARNLMSNQILSDYKTGVGIPRTLAGYGKSVAAFTGKGSSKMNKYKQELIDNGAIGRTNFGAGLKDLAPGAFKEKGKVRKVIEVPKKFQQFSEDTAKLNVYAYFRDQGMDMAKAMKKAEQAIFSPYNISAKERGAIRQLVPFYTFTRQAVPLVGEAALFRPSSVTKYPKFKTAVESLSPEGGVENKDALPSRMQGHIRLPIKDERGNYQYFDPTYINPSGNFDSEAGGQLPFGLGVNPLISEIGAQIYNKDLYFDQPIAKSNIPARARAQRINHAAQTFLPNILPTDFIGGIPTGQPGVKIKARGGSKLYDAFTGQPDYAGRNRSKTQAILDTLGLKSAAFDKNLNQSFSNSDKQKAIKAIQGEAFSITKDQRLSPEQRVKLLQDLNQARLEILAQ